MALSSAAIVAVYAAGYVRTEAAARQLAAPATATAPPSAGTVTAGGASHAAAGSASSSAAPATPPASGSTAARPQDAFEYRRERGNRDHGGFNLYTAPVPGAFSPAAGGTPGPQPITPPAASSTPGSAPAPQPNAYKDGTYTATGYGRHGPVEVTVVVRDGRIASADISRCGTRYPCSVISALPGEVVAQQSAQVDFVSGATDSSVAYQQAVAQALAQAQAR